MLVTTVLTHTCFHAVWHGGVVVRRGVPNSSDPQFQESWQDVYNRGPLKVLPWKVALGNHDWRGVVGAEVRGGVCVLVAL